MEGVTETFVEQVICTTCARTVVGSVPVAFGEPPPETATLFTTGDKALAATFTVTVIGGYDAAAPSASARVHVLLMQFQPVPAMDTRLRPSGTVSVTVTVPDVVPVSLLTVSAYVAFACP